MYVRELRRRLPAHYFQPVPHRIIWIPLYAAVVAGAIGIIAYADLHLAARLGLAVVIGLAFSGLELLGHEIIHGAMVRQPWLRELLGGLCLLPVGVAPMLWRLWHNVQHHCNAQVHMRDPDTRNTIEQYHQRPALRVLHRLIPAGSLLFFAMLSIWFTVHAMSVLFNTLRRVRGRDRVQLIAEALIPPAVWGSLGFWLGWEKWVYAFLLPFLINNFIVMAHIATNHFLNPLIENDDPLAGSLSLIEPKVLDVLLSNFSHHSEHHVFPAMSGKYLPHVRRLLRELWPDRYHEMTLWQALRALWQTPRLYSDNIRLVDPLSGTTYGTLGHGLDAALLRPLD